MGPAAKTRVRSQNWLTEQKNLERASCKLLTQLKSQKDNRTKSHKEDSELADRQIAKQRVIETGR